DHRIAMACTVASLYSNSETTIKNIEIVKDSYPEFIEDLIRLGANIEKANKED
ncbi:MAG: 3-phosphoshikimate 1-carboxyvinyltransferase, partial [Promethearchaeota archaeon]